MSLGSLTVSDVIDADNVQNMLNHDEGFQVLTVDRNSPPHWSAIRKFVFSKLRQCENPAFFLRLSAAETILGRTASDFY